MGLNSLSNSIRPKQVLQVANSASKPDRLTRFMKNKMVGSICETAANNPVICQSIFSLAICCAARPATNYITTPDKKDAAYASCHSISSGLMGFVWPLIIATPLAAGVGLALKKPQKFLKPELIKKFYPSVGLETIERDGKKITRVMTNAEGELLRQDGSVLCRELEPLKIKNGNVPSELKEIDEKIDRIKNPKKIDKILAIFRPSQETRIEKLNARKEELQPRLQEFLEEKAKFEAENADLYVDNKGVVRSRSIFKTKNGEYQLDDKGNKMGCVVQQDKTPVTEELENGINKEQNIKSIINWIPDILLAPPRAMLTIQLIPWLLKSLGMQKPQKGPKPEMAQQNNLAPAPIQANKQMVTANRPRFGTFATIASAQKKGGV